MLYVTIILLVTEYYMCFANFKTENLFK